MPDIDAIDQKIIGALRRDSRVSNADLAEAVGVSASSCWRRVRALEEAGIITGYGIRVDDAKMGVGFEAIVQVHLVRHEQGQLQEFIRAVKLQPEIRACFATTGQSDYHMIVQCSDITAYNRFLEEVLFRLPAVASAQTNVVLRSVKAFRDVK